MSSAPRSENEPVKLPVMPPVSPMLAKPVASIPPGASYEPKWDGFRSICFRDRDQVDSAAKHLKKLGVAVDLTAHYGFITQWLVAGPFDNGKCAGFHSVYPPEARVDVKATYLAGRRIT